MIEIFLCKHKRIATISFRIVVECNHCKIFTFLVASHGKFTKNMKLWKTMSTYSELIFMNKHYDIIEFQTIYQLNPSFQRYAK